MLFSLQFTAVLLIDLVIGDPRWFPHPVRFIGRICSTYEKILRKKKELLSEKAQGTLTFLGVILTVLASIFVVLEVSGWINSLLQSMVALVLLYLSVALGDLLKHSRVVLSQLKKDNLESARVAVSMMVGRDTAAMDCQDISRSCIESVAENLVDGVTAPIFWTVMASVFGLIVGLDPLVCAVFGAYSYKTINTMDSMFGYKNERYLEFGRCAAKADDFVNLVPARLSGFFVVVATFLSGGNYKNSYIVFIRDRLKSASPNAGHTEAAVAGALEIQLGGESSYFGVVTNKPFIAEGGKHPEADDIKKTNTLIVISGWLFTAFFLLFYALIELLVV